MPKYQLVNPYIIGSMNTSFEGNSSLEAANQLMKIYLNILEILCQVLDLV